ncbi:MAG: flagellar protein FlaG [Lachnospiraceae bacterium]|nr:flagellar protein FlaG [Lachnospiraceae bacterium]
MGIGAVSGAGSTINTQQVIPAQPVVEKQAVEAPVVEIQELHNSVEPSAQAPSPREEMQEGAQKRQQTEQEIEAENERIRKAVSTINKKLDQNTEAVFGVHEKTNRVTIKMVDKESKKVIKEFPPDKTLDMIAKVWELAGILVDEKG